MVYVTPGFPEGFLAGVLASQCVVDSLGGNYLVFSGKEGRRDPASQTGVK